MTLIPVQIGGQFVDLSQRIICANASVTAATGGAETVVATVTIPQNLSYNSGVVVRGYLNFTGGTGATSAITQIRQSNVTGSSVVASPNLAATAAASYERSLLGFDTGPANGQVYVLTLSITGGTASAPVGAATLVAEAL